MIQTKTQQEVAHLREGGRRIADILQSLKEYCQPGRPVAELNTQVEDLIAEDDAPAFFQYQPSGTPRPYPDKVCVSVNDTIVHGIGSESDHMLSDGDVVTVDMGLAHNDLITDSAITFVVGQSTSKKDNLIDTCKHALRAGIKKAQPSNHVGDISAAIEDAVGSEYAIFRQLVGHGVGYSVHEDPTIPNFGSAGSGPELPVGAVIAIEPMIGVGKPDITKGDDGYTYRTADGSLSAHFEHTVAVTEDGPLVLTKQEK
jgi:methionyl aminopeptidase